ncbi:MAG: hypothetical protein AABX24_04690 [Nanoarchaeota archaeon]
MKRENFLKLIGISTILLLVLNLVLFALKVITGLLFWAVIIISAVFAFKILPKMKK